jgi:sortase (surface protein transpeptidase)
VGYFASLRTASVGDRVSVRGADGRVHQYAVTARRSYRKAALPASVFSPDVAHRLVLITCTGAFDPATRSYEDNLVVYAVPIPR